MCNWICTEFCRTSSFPLSFVHWAAIPVHFHLGSLQHSMPPPRPPQATPQSIARFCSQGHGEEMDPSVPWATPRNRSWWSWNQDATKRWRSRALTKENSSCRAQSLECRALNCSTWDRAPVPLAEQKQEQDNFKASPKTGSYLLSRHDFKRCIKAPVLSFILSVIYRLTRIQKIA